MIAPRSIIRTDPRRVHLFGKRRPMLAVWCWCGRFYTLTPEEAQRLANRHTDRYLAGADVPPSPLCPNPECGKGAE